MKLRVPIALSTHRSKLLMYASKFFGKYVHTRTRTHHHNMSITCNYSCVESHFSTAYILLIMILQFLHVILQEFFSFVLRRNSFPCNFDDEGDDDKVAFWFP